MSDGEPRVFLSVGHEYLPEHRLLIDKIIAGLQLAGLSYHRLSREDYNLNLPTLPVYNAMKSCNGAVVIAYPRLLLRSGFEKPGSPEESILRDRYIASPWLQIEATMAHILGLPMLILVDDRLYPEGLLNPHHSAYSAQFYNMAASVEVLSEVVVNAIETFADLVKDLAHKK